MTKSLTKPYVGIGGWTYEPWRGVFYPKGLTHAELEYAGQHLTSIEVNGTFYSTQSPKTYRKWASEVPDGFVFSLKGPRYAVNRRVLAEAGDSIKRFLESGITELGPKLGPLLGNSRHTRNSTKAISAHSSICCRVNLTATACATLSKCATTPSRCRPSSILPASTASPASTPSIDSYTEIADITADFVYARLQKGDEKLKAGYPPKALDAWAKRGRDLAQGWRARRPAARRQEKGREDAARCRLSISSTKPNCARRPRQWRLIERLK